MEPSNGVQSAAVYHPRGAPHRRRPAPAVPAPGDLLVLLVQTLAELLAAHDLITAPGFDLFNQIGQRLLAMPTISALSSANSASACSKL